LCRLSPFSPLSGQTLELSTGKELKTLSATSNETAFPAYKHSTFVISENKPVLPSISIEV
jgi:hypothetical protein